MCVLGYLCADDKQISKEKWESDMAKKKLNQAEPNTQTATADKGAKSRAYYEHGEAMKAQSPAFARYIGVLQKMYAGIPFWVLTILMTVITVLQALDVISMFTIAPAYGAVQAFPFIFVAATTVLMWYSVFHAKRKSDNYYPVRGMLAAIFGCFVLFLISSVSVSFITSGFGSYIGTFFERISETSVGEVMADFSAKFSDAIAYGSKLGALDLGINYEALKPASSAISEEWYNTLLIALIFGAIVMVIILAVRSIMILKAIANSRNSVEYSEKVGDAKITGKQYIIYGIISFVCAILVFLLNPLLNTMNWITTGFKFTYEALSNLTFGDGLNAEFLAPGAEAQEYLEVLSIPMIFVAMIGLLAFAAFQVYRMIVLFGVAAKVDGSVKTGLVPNIRLASLGVLSVVLSVLTLSNGITWCCAFFFSRIGGISLLTAIGKVLLIGVVILMVGILALKNKNELTVCYMTQCKERGEQSDVKVENENKQWSIGVAALATVGVVVAWFAAHWLMNTVDSFGGLVLQILPFMGSYDLNVFGGGLMNELLYTLNELGDQANLIFANINQIVLRAGLVVAAVVWMTSRCRFYKSGYSPDATQKVSGASLIAPKVFLYIFSVITAILVFAQLLLEGAWAGEVLGLVGSLFDMTVLLALPMFFFRKAKLGKLAKILIPTAIGVVTALAYTFLFELDLSLAELFKLEGGVKLFVTILVSVLVFQTIRWLFATTYYVESNNLIPVVFFDFLMVMMMNFVVTNLTGSLIAEGAVAVAPAVIFELIKALAETFKALGGDAAAEAALALIPYLVDLVVVVIGVASMLAIAVILLVRNLKAETLPGDELCDLDHVEEEDEFLTEAEMLARQEAEAAKAE